MTLRNPRASAGPFRSGVGRPGRLLAVAVLFMLAAVLWIASQDPQSDPPRLMPENPAPAEVQGGGSSFPEEGGARLPGLPGEGPVVVEMRYLGRQPGERLRPLRGGVLEGRIRTEDGQGVADCLIRIQGGPQDGRSTRSEASGSYLMTDLLPGTHFFVLEVPGREPVGRLHRVTGLGRSRRDFYLGVPIRLELLVRDHENKALAGAKVRLDLGRQETVSNGEGLVFFDGVTSGPRVLVDVLCEGFVPVRHELNLAPIHAQRGPVELPPMRRGAKIRGQVKSWPGNPLPTITVVPRTDRPGPQQVIWERWHGLTVGANGRFLLEDLPSDRMIDIRVFHPEGVSSPRAIKPVLAYAANVDFVVKRGRERISGQVVDEGDQPVAGALVALEAADPGAVLGKLYPGLQSGPTSARLPMPAALRREWTTGVDGRFDFAWGDHPPGSGHLILSAFKEGYSPSRREIRSLRSSTQLVLRKEVRTGALQLARLNGGPLPEADQIQWWLDGKLLAKAEDLEVGFYHLLVRRGELVLFRQDSFSVQGPTEIPLP
ncbi:MAG: carboxypeptidase regulatory-like domain-containing protein [Planctomycetota bacterium]|nr:MAG: carboxypeptidase regulatory-like domain-containing protein [Planctomycetota bacterium]